MLVTISGLPGSGTSTVSRLVASEMGIAHVDGGSIFRALAAERGLSLTEFATLAESDSAIDRALDDRLGERAADGDVLIESRLAGWLARRHGLEGVRVWVACGDRERARRVAERDGHTVDDALAVNARREASERARYLDYYEIDLTDLSIYDLVLESTASAPTELAEQVVATVQSRA